MLLYRRRPFRSSFMPVRTGRKCWQPSGGRAGGGFEQVHPFGLAVPAFEQVQGDVPAAVAGGPGGDVDKVAAQRDAAGLGIGEASQ